MGNDPVSAITYIGRSPRYTVGFIRKFAHNKVGDSGTISILIQKLSRHMASGYRFDTTLLTHREFTVRLAKRLHVAPHFLEVVLRDQGDEGAPAENGFESSEQERKDPLVLLLPLMESGADVHALVTDWEWEGQCSLTDYARGLGLENIWNSALERCGYSPTAVEAESKRRLANARRLDGGNASGIDVGSLEIQGPSGLRRRRRRGRTRVS